MLGRASLPGLCPNPTPPPPRAPQAVPASRTFQGRPFCLWHTSEGVSSRNVPGNAGIPWPFPIHSGAGTGPALLRVRAAWAVHLEPAPTSLLGPGGGGWRPKIQGQMRRGACQGASDCVPCLSCPLLCLGPLHPCLCSEPLQTPFLLGGFHLGIMTYHSLCPLINFCHRDLREGPSVSTPLPFLPTAPARHPPSAAPLGPASVPGTQPLTHPLGPWPQPPTGLGGAHSVVFRPLAPRFKCPFLTEASTLPAPEPLPTAAHREVRNQLKPSEKDNAAEWGVRGAGKAGPRGCCAVSAA